MKVNFNNLRKKACVAYNSIVDTLNETAKSPPHGEDEMVVYKDDIQDDLNWLRDCLSGIICTYEEGNEDFKDLSDEIELKSFNYEEDEEMG